MSAARTAQRRFRAGLAGCAVAACGLAGPMAAPATAANSTAKVNIVHGIPGVAVKVCIDGKAAADRLRYGNTIVGATLTATTHHVRLVAAGKSCHAAAVLKGSYTLDAGRDYTIVANLDRGGTPDLRAFVNNMRPTAVGKARLTVRHTAQAPAVNVWAGNAKLIGGRSFTWGKGATVAVPPGTYPVKVTLPGSRKAVIGPVPETLRRGRAYQIYAVGSPGHYRLLTVKIAVGTS